MILDTGYCSRVLGWIEKGVPTKVEITRVEMDQISSSFNDASAAIRWTSGSLLTTLCSRDRLVNTTATRVIVVGDDDVPRRSRSCIGGGRLRSICVHHCDVPESVIRCRRCRSFPDADGRIPAFFRRGSPPRPSKNGCRYCTLLCVCQALSILASTGLASFLCMNHSAFWR